MLFPIFSEIKIQSYFQGIGDLNLAYQCFKLTLVNNNDYAEAYNNLAVLEMQKGHIEQVGVNLSLSRMLSLACLYLKITTIGTKNDKFFAWFRVTSTLSCCLPLNCLFLGISK